MKASEHLKRIRRENKEFRESFESMGKSISSPFEGFSGSLKAAMEESLKTTEGLKSSKSDFLPGRLESLEVAKAGIAARISEMTRGSR